ncbi:MAG: hypothetical protein LBE91_01510 [Tannerella sp.]|nr:hypothetical protein [Tannerella sp.]
MATKIKNISISGIRGIKGTVTLSPDGKSVLLYGDNGTGKSSISDAVEWFYTDRVAHLSGSEIDLKEALRNSWLNDTDTSTVAIGYSQNSLDTAKNLQYKKNKLVAELSNPSGEFSEYYRQSGSENLLLRYQQLRGFVDQTKGERLTYLSGIIGFSEVTKTKDVLKKAFNATRSEIRAQNFEGQINVQKQTLIAKIGAAASQEENLFDKINEIINPLKTGIAVKSVADIDAVLNHIKKPVNTKQVSELQFLERIHQVLSALKSEINFLDGEYQKYFGEFNKIAEDVQAIMQTFLAQLLQSGETVLTKKYHRENTCPLCLQPKKAEELLSDIQRRLREIEESSKRKAAFDAAKQTVANTATERSRRLDAILENPLLNVSENENIKKAVAGLKAKIYAYQKAAEEKVTSGNKLPEKGSLILSESDFSILDDIAQRIEKIQAAIRKDNSTELYANISAAKDAFLKIKLFEKEKNRLEHQKQSLELIYNEFVKRQKEGLERFINTFSESINEFYQYMNPGEQFHEIRIVTVGEEDELNGITVEYKYRDEWVSPPQKYFSESHLNCFGISFFLASVIAFNKENRFIILDDVISSFDITHRERFANLLFEKFADYQIILLTHETEWFDRVRQIAEGKNWLIHEIKWSEARGTHLEE